MLDLQWGFGALIGTTYTLTVQAAFFLVMGLGVRLETSSEVNYRPGLTGDDCQADDAFVIMAAHRDVPRTFDAKERVARTLARAGVSITITSGKLMLCFSRFSFYQHLSLRTQC